MSTLAEQHARFTQQARWTAELRRYIAQSTGLSASRRILEVGCGTGAVLKELPAQAALHALDHHLPSLVYARQSAAAARCVCADAHRLPYPAGWFDHSLCHFVLLWLQNPLQALREMVRVTRPGGWVIALAEPDYGGRMDYPTQFTRLGQLQAQALAAQGADVNMGRKCGALFHQAGLTHVQTGLLGGQWSVLPSPEAWESEWETLQSDLRGLISPQELHDLRQQDAAAWEKGERILFVPTFYAWGQVPQRY